jgi:hypothetical protein
VFLSDLTAELADEGLTWPEIGIDYEAVTDQLVALHRRRAVRALRLAQLSDVAVTLLASGPNVRVHVAAPASGPPKLLAPTIFQARREELRAMIRADLERMAAKAPSIEMWLYAPSFISSRTTPVPTEELARRA